MLNLFNKKSKNILNSNIISQSFFNMSQLEKTKNRLGETRHYTPSIKEWFNSVYVYNKNYFFKSLPITDKIINRLIKSYFNLSPNKFLKFKRLSVKRIFVSKAEIKHTNNKVIITVYTYNRHKKFIVNKIKKFLFMFIQQNKLKSNNISYIEKAIKNFNLSVFSTEYNLNNIYLNLKKIISARKKLSIKSTQSSKNWKDLKTMIIKNYYKYMNNSVFNYNSYLIIKNNNSFLRKKLYDIFFNIGNLIIKVKKKNKLILRALNWRKDTLTRYKKQYLKNFISLLIKKEFKNVLLYQYFVAMLYYNNYKFKSNNLLGLKNILGKIYNKKVELNIVNLKYLHLNTDILSESMVKKLKNRSNRLLKVLKKALSIIKIPYLIKYFEKDSNISYLNDFSSPLIINKELISQDFSNNEIQNSVFDSIKHKIINGARLEGKGRLTRRLTASRSIFKYKYKGGLKNIDSSYKNKSAILLRGHIKSNVQHTLINSKTRNGAFGIKSWVSNY